MFSFARMHIRPTDAIHVVDEADYVGHLYHLATGARQENEISVTYYAKGTTVAYHMHTRGFETFTLDKGRAEVIIAGKKCIIEAGDMVHIEPYMPHGFKFLEDGSAWRELFQGMDLFGNHNDKFYINNGNMALMEGTGFLSALREKNGSCRLEEPVAIEVDKADMPMICPRGTGEETFSFDGFSMTLKIGRWRLSGNKEVWEYRSGKNMCFRFGPDGQHEAIYFVCEGRVRVQAAARHFTAQAGDIIAIPQYTPYTLQALEDDTVLHDYNCKATLFHLLEDIEIEKRKAGGISPETLYALCAANKLALAGYKKL